MRKKTFYIILLAFCSFGQIGTSYAQDDSLNTEYNDSEALWEETEEKDIEEVVADNEAVRLKINNALIKDSAATVTRVEFAPGFQSKYTGEEYQYDFEVSKNGLWTRFKLWMIDKLMRLFNMESIGKAGQVFDVIYYTIIGLGIALLIYLLVKVILFKDKKWIFQKAKKQFEESIVDIEDALQVTNYETLIQQLKDKGDYRAAIRYYYAWTLKGLIEKEIVLYAPDKTSMDYVREIKDLQLKKDFEYAAYLFNYIWYGAFDISLMEFEKASNQFLAIIKR